MPLNIWLNIYKELHWMYVLTRRYLHQDAGKTYSEISNMRSYWMYSKATICRDAHEKEYCRLEIY